MWRNRWGCARSLTSWRRQRSLASLNIDCQVPGITGSPWRFNHSVAGSKPSAPQMNRRRRCRGLSVSTGRRRPPTGARRDRGVLRVFDQQLGRKSGHRCRGGEPVRSARRGRSGCSPRPRVAPWRGCRSGGLNHSWRSPMAIGSANRRDARRCRGHRTASGWPAPSTAVRCGPSDRRRWRCGRRCRPETTDRADRWADTREHQRHASGDMTRVATTLNPPDDHPWALRPASVAASGRRRHRRSRAGRCKMGFCSTKPDSIAHR